MCSPPVRFLLLVVFATAIGLPCRAAEVVVVRGDYTAAASPGEAPGVRAYCGNVKAALEAVGVQYEEVGDADVERGALEGRSVAVFAYSSAMTAEEVAQVRAFVEAGGRIIVFYTASPELRDILGLGDYRHLKAQYDGQFATVAFSGGPLAGLPEHFAQGSWNIHAVTPAAGTRVLGTWRDSAGRDTPYPAVTLNENGAFMGHVLLGGDLPAKGRMLLAVIGHFAPEVWEQATGAAIARVGRVGPFRSLSQFRRRLRQQRAQGADVSRPLASLDAAAVARRGAVHLARERRFPQAIDEAGHAAALAEGAYHALFRPRPGELRAVWMGASGVPTWEETMRNLARNGFNAVFPNMCSGGIAHYESDVLPRAKQVREGQDTLAECLKWGKRYGIAVHVWRINWYLSGSEPEHVEELKRQDRLQVSAEGEGINWLCPSQEVNRRLEVDAMLELVRKYDVDGIHFDYIRYPSSAYCYCEHCRRAFETWAGVTVRDWPLEAYEGDLRERYLQFRRHQITSLVKQVSEEARRVKPSVVISAAVFGDWERSPVSIGQETRRWLEEGYLDLVCPMDYTDSNERLAALTQAQVRAVAGRVPLAIGIGAFSSSSQFESPARLADQVDIARRLGADGFVIFHYNEPLARDFLPAMRAGTTERQTFPSYVAPRVTFELSPRHAEGLQDLEFGPGDSVRIEAMVAMESSLRERLSRVTGTAWRESCDDGSWARLAQFDLREPSLLKVEFTDLQPGRWRLALEGNMTFANGRTVPFVRRGPVLVVEAGAMP
jgi:uncharacterized lipoprotein YddW (UPF0748 family)